MEIYGYLTFVGDLQEIPTQNSQYGNEPFFLRDVCIHTFSTSTQDGQVVPYLRGIALRLTGRMAQNFALLPGACVAAEYSSSAHTYTDKSNAQRRASSNLTISRITEVKNSDIEGISRLIGA